MILLWGAPTDAGLAQVALALRRRDARFEILDQDAPAVVYLGETPDDGAIETGHRRLALRDTHAAFLRPSAAPARPAWRDFLTWVDAVDRLVVNRPSPSASNASKPYQQRLIAQAGFRVPETLITTDAAELERFSARPGRVIFKSISGQRSIVTGLDRASSALLENLRWCPTMFQRYVPGTEYRAHLVGEHVFTARIESTADDYRFGPADGSSTAIRADRLPLAIEARVRSMCASMGLALAGVDLRRTPRGVWYCFEVNPSPTFMYYERATGQPIAAAIADLLADA